ncbi:MAG: DUF4412 domain-containing protein [Verrucomicrobia bacterium]|nr:DUF4412 domain-containing protein [Verrucomicrobiota bacterium]
MVRRTFWFRKEPNRVISYPKQSDAAMRFIRQILFAGILGLTACEGRADLTVVLTLENLRDEKPTGKEQNTFYVSGKRIRFDQGQRMSSVILNDRKVTFSIDHLARQYMVLSHDQIKADDPSNKSSDHGGGTLDPSLVESTGKTQQIGGYQCRQVRLKEKDGIVTELWMADHALDINAFMGEFQGFMEFGLAQAPQELEKHPALRGVPIRVIEYQGAKALRRATITRLDTGKIAASVFEVPAGYSEIRMSDIPPPPAATVEDEAKSPKR